MQIIDENETYKLNLEFMGKANGGWWLELIDRATGKVKILTAPRKELFNGVRISHALRWMDDQEFKPMYKPERKPISLSK